MVIILSKTSKIEAQMLLAKGLLLVLLGVQLIIFQGCSTPSKQEHKWLLYDLGKENGVQYQGYAVSTKQPPKTKCDDKKEQFPESGPCTTHNNVQTFLQEVKPYHEIDHPLPGFIPLDKPTVDEDDQLHFVYFGQSDILNRKATSCVFTDAPYDQPHDAKMAPAYKAPDTKQLSLTAQAAETLVGQYEMLVERKRQAADFLKTQSDYAKEQLKLNRNDLNKAQIAEKMAAAAREANASLSEAEKLLVDAKLSRDQIKAAAATNVIFVCDIDVREKGGTKILHTLETNLKLQEFEPGQEAKSDKTILVKDSVLVHNLYRFRVQAGPVFSTLRHKTYSLTTNSSGQSEVTASHANTSPANFALMLKTYLWAKRDVLNPPSLFSSRGYEMINPVIGINLLDNPLKNLYAGLSLELAGGFDIVGGVHWAKTQQLTGGFYEGQITTQSNVATKERFTNGWFVGVAADIGIITTWLKNAGSGIVTAIKTTP